MSESTITSLPVVKPTPIKKTTTKTAKPEVKKVEKPAKPEIKVADIKLPSGKIKYLCPTCKHDVSDDEGHICPNCGNVYWDDENGIHPIKD